MSNSLRLSVIGIMLITALALGMMALRLTHPARTLAPARTVTPTPLEEHYLVAAHPLPAGTLARDADFTAKALPDDKAPADGILNTPAALANLRGALIRTYINAGQPILQADVLRPRDRGFLASVLGSGMRAISIGVDPVSGVAGLIWPGDHVDVLLTQTLNNEPAGRRVLSETVLTNVRVIAIDQEIVQGAPAGASAAGKLARTVTLEVTPEQAEKVTVAEHIGRLDLAIRAAEQPKAPAEVAQRTMFGRDVSPALSKADHPVGQTVQVIEGNKRSLVTFR